MDQSTKDRLKKAIQLLKDGDGQAAAPLLAQVLKKEPDLEQAWYLLGMALDDEAKKRRAFNQALKLNPQNEKARRQLEKLDQPPAASPPPPPPPQEEEPVDLFGASDSPFGGEEDALPFPTEEFELPDWMQESDFNPADYTTSALSAEPEELNSPDEDDKPDWAKTLNPWENPVLPQDDEEPEEEEEDRFADFSGGFAEEEPEDEQPSWAALSSSQEDYAEEPYQPYEEEEEEERWDEPFISDEEESAQRISAFFEEEDQTVDQDGAEEKEPDWLRDMVNEEEEETEKKKMARVRLTPDQKRQRWRIVRNILILLVIAGLGYLGYQYRGMIKPYVEPYLEPVQTWTAPLSQALTEGAPITVLLTPGYFDTPSPTQEPPSQPTPEPTWTPEGGGAVLPPDGGAPVEAPVTTPVASEIQEEDLAAVARIDEEVAIMRNQPAPGQLDRKLVSESALHQAMSNYLLTEENLTQIAQDEIALRALGFVNGNYDLTEGFLNTRADPVGGYYVEDENTIYVVGGEFGTEQQYIYAHEYAHALQDANFGMNKLGIYPNCEKPLQSCLATLAIVEGEATLVTNLWYALHPPEGDLTEFIDEVPDVLFQDSPLPDYYRMNAQFPFTQGLEFVQNIYEEGGWKAVSRIYTYIPVTTEQILHPEKYQRGEIGADMAHPDLSYVLKDGWTLLRDESLGEWESYLLLAYNDYYGQPEAAAAEAAAGWGGDEYQVYYNADTGKTFLSAYWLWETQEDSDQFFAQLKSYLNARHFTAMVDGPGDGVCWFYEQQMSCAYQSGRFILWLYSDEVSLIEEVLPRFTKFN
ncbi:hypothetical protein KQH61_03550 [bacterium]|nr:hypothetical protein [bacterium]MCB2178976.1 hypothetical protein [bacterium]